VGIQRTVAGGEPCRALVKQDRESQFSGDNTMIKPMLTDIEVMDQIIQARHWDPHSILGLHPLGKNPLGCSHVVRAWLPQAKEVRLVDSAGVTTSLARVHPEGFFEIGLKQAPSFPIRYEIENPFGEVSSLMDPYQFEPVIGEMDLYLVGEGNHERLYDRLGAHVITHQDVAGVVFSI
jgi:1,4-alpha-glucan branching enzyme